MGRVLILPEKSGALVVCQSTGDSLFCGKLRWGIGGSWIVFHRGLRFEVLDSAGDESLEYSGSAGDRSFL